MPTSAQQPVPIRLVMIHGLSSTPREFGLLVHPLRRLGVSMRCPEIPGYSYGLLRDPTRWSAWVAAAAAAVDAIAAESTEPFVLGGLCTGAMLAVALAASGPQPKLRGLALLSPLFAYDGWALPWWYRLRHLAYGLGLTRFFSMAERSPYGLKNERMRQWVRQQMGTEQTAIVGPERVALAAVRESELLSRHARECLPRLKQPALVMHARDDEICNLASVHDALARAPAGLVRMEILSDSYHMITADNDRQRVAQALADFVFDRISSTTSPVSRVAAQVGQRGDVDLWTPSTI